MESAATGTPDERALHAPDAVPPAAQETIRRLLHSSGGGHTAPEVAAATGLRLPLVRAYLDRLTAAGVLVKARSSEPRPRLGGWRYRAVDAPESAPYRTLTSTLLDRLPGTCRAARSAERAGREWGRRLAAASRPHDDPADTVVEVLTGLGFRPDRQPRATAAATTDATAAADATDSDSDATVDVHLRACPMLDLVGRNPDAMCELHAGLIRGVLERAGPAGGTAVLEPFAAPGVCVVRLTPPR